MIEFKANLNRFYDTKRKKIVSKKRAMEYARKTGKIPVAVIGKKSKSRTHKTLQHHNRPSYKKMYKHAAKQVRELEKQYSVANKKLSKRPTVVDTRFHSFLAQQTKDGLVNRKTVERNVNDYLKDHHCELFVVAALNSDETHSFIDACGTISDLKLRGFIQRDLIPGLLDKFGDGYDE